MYTMNFPLYNVLTLEQVDRINVDIEDERVVKTTFYADYLSDQWENTLQVQVRYLEELPIRSALIVSLKKWCYIVQLVKGLDPDFWDKHELWDGSSNTCGLCLKYAHDSCYGCPISNATGEPSCQLTAWKRFNWAESKEAALSAAISMYMFIMELFQSYEDETLVDGYHFLEANKLYPEDQMILEEEMCDCPMCSGEEDDPFIF